MNTKTNDPSEINEEDDDVDYGDSHDFDNYDGDEIEFADPGGNSALRAATDSNPRNLPCPTCGGEDRLTPADVALGYQCNSCADRAERGLDC